MNNLSKDITGILDKKSYLELESQIHSLLEPKLPLISNLVNFIALLKDRFDKISWIGYYFLTENTLFLGPFQGKVACTTIQLGEGVCGKVALKKELIVVENVHEFEGHIACDTGSNSEIVLPLIYEDRVLGVLDIDSYNLAAFSEIDSKYLTDFLSILTAKLDFSKFNFS